jgi:hypothetical protein
MVVMYSTTPITQKLQNKHLENGRYINGLTSTTIVVICYAFIFVQTVKN